MRRIAFLLAILLIVAVSTKAQQPAPVQTDKAPPAAQAAEPPKSFVDVAEKTKDFGVVAQGERIKATFVVKNTGSVPVEITSVRPTCGCTVADDYDHKIPPGGSGKINAMVETVNFTGPISKAILVSTSDPGTPQINLVVKAEVKVLIDVLPKRLIFFRGALQGEVATEKVTLVSTDGANFKILGIDPQGLALKSTFKELQGEERMPDRPGSQWEVVISVAPDAPTGPLSGKIVVSTNYPKCPTVTINVSGAVNSVIQVVPPNVNLNRVKAGLVSSNPMLLIYHRPNSQLQISEAKVDNPNFAVEIKELEPGVRFQLNISVLATAPKGTYKSILRITTNDVSRKVMEIPVEAIVE